MPEYIEREALIEDIAETVVFTVREGVKLPTSEMRGANKVIDRIKSAPTADVVEVRHGEWIVEEELKTPLSKAYIRKEKTYYCPYCKKRFRQRMKFCGECGAKMDGKGGCDEID